MQVRAQILTHEQDNCFQRSHFIRHCESNTHNGLGPPLIVNRSPWADKIGGKNKSVRHCWRYLLCLIICGSFTFITVYWAD